MHDYFYEWKQYYFLLKRVSLPDHSWDLSNLFCKRKRPLHKSRGRNKKDLNSQLKKIKCFIKNANFEDSVVELQIRNINYLQTFKISCKLL
jgi:hypothetical protein